MRQFSYLVKIN